MNKMPNIIEIKTNSLLDILILEDNEFRHNFFNQKLKAFCNLTICIDAITAIEQIRIKKFNIIFLDHDLTDRIFIDSNDLNTGYQVAKIIPETVNAKTKVIVHSLNSIGVNNICSILPHAKKFPFGTFSLVWNKKDLIIKKIA
jgi:superfamily II DNA or RNA helicase